MTFREWLNAERGRREQLADELDVTVFAVNQWLQRQVPAERCIAIERATKNQVTRYDLRPEVFGKAPKAAA